jgi:hypothetical protein
MPTGGTAPPPNGVVARAATPLETVAGAAASVGGRTLASTPAGGFEPWFFLITMAEAKFDSDTIC